MGLFGFGKNKEKNEKSGCGCNCNCGNSQHTNTNDTVKFRIIVLGACCEKSSKTFENVKIAASELGLSDDVVNIGDMATIASYGVMSTPALVIENKVVSIGKLIKVDEAKDFIQKSGIIVEHPQSNCGCSNSEGNSCCGGK